MTPRPSKFRSLLAVIILALGGVAAFVLIRTAPQTEPTVVERAAKIVQTINVVARSEPISVTGEGTVIPTREVTVIPEIRGLIVRHHPALVPGGLLLADEEMVTIDRADYQLALQEHQAALEEAKFELTVEQGRQVVAKREFDLLEKDLNDSDVNKALVLRTPHLERAEAALTKAQNAIAKAELDLSRTSVRAPFNAVVITESMEVGQLVNAGSAICTLAGTDSFWVSVTLPMDQLHWIRFPRDGQPGADVTISLDTGHHTDATWKGEVERLMSDLETSTRLAKLVVRVDHPLETSTSGSAPRLPLLIGSFVRVEIDAGMLDNVIAIPRAALREGDFLWLADAADQLQIRKTEVQWKQDETLFVSNSVRNGERLIVSDLRAPLPGMKVQPRDATPTPTP